MGMELETAAQAGIHSQSFVDLIGSVGEPAFARNVLLLAHRVCGADHSSVFHWRCGKVAVVASLNPASIDGSDTAHRIAERYVQGGALTRDPAFVRSLELTDRSPLLFHADMRATHCARLRGLYEDSKISDRITLCQRSDDDIIGVSVLRGAEHGKFSEGEVWRLQNLLDPLLALSRKHLSIVGSGPDLSACLKSLEVIEACLENGPIAFPRREAQVCSRIIYGITTAGIACELGVAEETVSTYRKRVYSRLGIATQRELLLWYLSTWSTWGRQCHEGHSIH